MYTCVCVKSLKIHIVNPTSFVCVCQIGTCVSMNGHPQPRIIWFKDDQPLPEVKDKKESMGRSLCEGSYQTWCTGKVVWGREIHAQPWPPFLESFI